MDNQHARIEVLHSARPPFLSLVTPCYKRPVALARNRASVEAQGRDDIEQVRVIDDVGRGWEWVAREVADATHWTTGTYVMGLDDDDELIPGAVDAFVEALGALETLPDVVVVKCDIEYRDGTRVIVPEPDFWGHPPTKGHISGQCVIVRRDIRLRHLDSFHRDGGDIAIDYPWMKAIMDISNGYRVLWLPLVMSRMQSRGMGIPEAETEVSHV